MEHQAIIGVGVDILETKRFSGIRFLSRVVEFFLTSTEIAEFTLHSDPIRYAASRFALKEAVIKAYPEKLGYHDIEIGKMGVKPNVKIHNLDSNMLVSLSHSTDYVAGFAIAH